MPDLVAAAGEVGNFDAGLDAIADALGRVGEAAHRAGDGARQQKRQQHHDQRGHAAVSIWSMSSPCVDSIRAPWMVRERCTGTATETITSPRELTRTMLRFS